MTKGIGTALVLAALTLPVSTAIAPAADQKLAAPGATDVSARAHDRHAHYAYHPYYPYYYGRPYYYSPGPIMPFPRWSDSERW